MKVLGICGSPREGATEFLLKKALKDLECEESFETKFITVRDRDISPCTHCNACAESKGKCSISDGMDEIYDALREADGIILASPIHFGSISAQLKAVIDRFYANDAVLHGNKKAVLMVAMADDNLETANGALETFKGMTKYLEWDIAGTVIGVNCMTPDMLKNTDYPKQAYELGKAL